MYNLKSIFVKKTIMVADKLENAKLYFNLGERINKGLKYILDSDFSKSEPGIYEIEGKNIFAIVTNYKSRLPEEAKIENHKKYIDIQYIVEGSEQIGYAPYTGQNPLIAYDEDKDIAFYHCEISLIKFEQNSFGIFFPQDIHAPCIATDRPSDVKKVVIKVKVD